MLSVEVAPCQEADLVHLVARLPTPGHPQRHAARFARQQSGQSTFLIAWSAGLPVGAGEIRWRGCAAPEVLARFPECPELNGLDVWPPELRSHGIGTALVRAAEGEVRSRGGGQLGLGVEDGNVLAAALYLRLGYREPAATTSTATTTSTRAAAGRRRRPGRFLVKPL